jgi:Holliday junction DNA helicase RuvA
MIAYLRGDFTEITPTNLTVECGGVGYFVHISLHTYEQIRGIKSGQILIHQVIREDAHWLYGFNSDSERELFRLLISVSGVGSATARMVLSSVNPIELERAILSGDVFTLKKVKGIGAKTAERILLDLRDKVGRGSSSALWEVGTKADVWSEAGMALQALGFTRSIIDKALSRMKAETNPDVSVEQIVRDALKYL